KRNGLPARTNPIAWDSPRNAIIPAAAPQTAGRCAAIQSRNERRRIDARGITPNPTARTARSVIAAHFERFAACTARTWYTAGELRLTLRAVKLICGMKATLKPPPGDGVP